MIYQNPNTGRLLTARQAPNGCYVVDPDRLPAGTVIDMAVGSHSVIPAMDFETYSEAGFTFNGERWLSVKGKGQKAGLPVVGVPVYSEHPTAEIISLAYDLRDGYGVQLWVQGMPPPVTLFEYLETGGPMEAHNALFEWFMWHNVCRRMGWPFLDPMQLRDSAAKASQHGLPAALGKLTQVLGTREKDPEGMRLIKKFTMPRTPTKKDPRQRIMPADEPVDAAKFYSYNIDDVNAEAEASAHIPDLDPFEHEVYQADKLINIRGVQIDTKALADCQYLVEQCKAWLNPRLAEITGGVVQGATKVQDMTAWLRSQGTYTPSLDKDTVTSLLKRDDLTPEAREVLTIRQKLGASSVAKFDAIAHTVSADGRLRNLYKYCGAGQTRRWSGSGAQPQNLPSDGCPVCTCDNCGQIYDPSIPSCPNCLDNQRSKIKWRPECVDMFLTVAASRDLNKLLAYTTDPLAALSGCLRGMFIAAPGKELHGADFSAIEAVVLACVAGEQWRIEVFQGHGKIYEMSASMITGVSFDEMMEYKQRTDQDHPLRKTIGKVAELASGYGGSVGSWKAFGADKFMSSDEEIKAAVDAWREKSPAIVALWYACERAAMAAIRQPGMVFKPTYRRAPGQPELPNDYLAYCLLDGVLYCRLPSGGFLKYHNARIIEGGGKWGQDVILFEGIDAITKQWATKDTYGGRLVENAMQAIARDIQAHGMINARRKQINVVMHTHDELTAEAPIGAITNRQLADCMQDVPAWCSHWPIRVPDGWTGHRYRKD